MTMTIKIIRRPKYLKVDIGDKFYTNSIRADRFSRFGIRTGQFDGNIENILETWLEDQVRLFIYSNKEVPQELEELLAKEKSKEYIRKQKKFNPKEYDYYGILSDNYKN